MNNKLTNFCRKIYHDPFKRYLVISLVILGAVLLLTGQQPAKPTASEGFEVHFFYAPSCSHCEAQKSFNIKLAKAYPLLNFIYHDISTSEGSALLSEMLANVGVETEYPETPVTIFSGLVFSGWESEGTTGEQIEAALQQCLAGNCPQIATEEPSDETTLPIIGKIRLSDYSLPSLAVILGFVDGFNPCAMWVLAYLISLIMTLKDKRRIWLLVGSFVFASGVLYFLFMTAWLNAFLLIGYFRPVTIVIGLAALGAGTLNIREFIRTKGAIVCEVGDEESRKKTMRRMEKVVFSPLTLATIAGIIALAFVVNLIEFVCSAAIPAIFTHVLSLSNLPTLRYYAYILLYDFFFMLDDLIIFGSAALAMTSSLGDRYAKYCKPLGGTILFILGVLLLFAPRLLP
jgi:thiol-disulfide isomerase/thioredoxin